MNKAGSNITLTELYNLPFHTIARYWRHIEDYLEEEERKREDK